MDIGKGKKDVYEFLPNISVLFIPIIIKSAFEPSAHPVDSKCFKSALLQQFCEWFCIQFPQVHEVLWGDSIAVMDNAMGSWVSTGENGGQALVGRVPAGVTVFELDAIPGYFIDMGT